MELDSWPRLMILSVETLLELLEFLRSPPARWRDLLLPPALKVERPGPDLCFMVKYFSEMRDDYDAVKHSLG